MKITISLAVGIIIGVSVAWIFPKTIQGQSPVPNCSLVMMEDSMHSGLYMQCTNGKQSGSVAMNMEGAGGGTPNSITFYHDIGNEEYETRLIQYIPSTCNLNE